MDTDKLDISPKYLMTLIDEIEKMIWKEFIGYKKVHNYIKKWHKSDYNYSNYWENFEIIVNDERRIDLTNTLHNIKDSEIILKIAIDLDIETPDFIPSISNIKNTLKANYNHAFKCFEKALKEVSENPDNAIAYANSTLESIVKHILDDDILATKLNKSDTLYKLVESILKEFSMFPEQPIGEIKRIGSSLLNISKNIEDLRSEQTFVHGKSGKDYIIQDPLYSIFIINSVATVGLFLINFYEKKFKINKSLDKVVIDDELPF